jgi:hypothetical protein
MNSWEMREKRLPFLPLTQLPYTVSAANTGRAVLMAASHTDSEDEGLGALLEVRSFFSLFRLSQRSTDNLAS